MPEAAALKVMIVDDQRAIRSLVSSCLRTLGCTGMVECGDGLEALGMLARQPVHLVISDLNMPNLDGLGLLRAIRSDPALSGMAVIMLTSRTETALVRQAVDLRVNNYLVKPFTMAALKKKIEGVFGPLT